MTGKLIFQGTGTSQGVPVIGCQCKVCQSLDERDKRLRTSGFVEIDGKKILIDAGPDFRQQLLRTNISALDGILITHAHKDHIGGLDDVRALNYCSGKPVDVYGENRVLKAIRNEFAYAFAPNPYPGVPAMQLHEISLETFELNGIEIKPIRAMHHKLPVLGFCIAGLVYITDANSIASEEIARIKGCDTLVLNALQREIHISHFSLKQALDVVAEVAPRVAYLTHISHRMGLHAMVEKELPEGVGLAYDGLEIELK
ncbi:MAG: MBL fold metallo-hydrolase [Prevotellaceae bacterium]|jgi:phosphoribosyl 1,2-cyclic phosphate phosphodiesterase|nr:MBL fold metallo-hydrolase [Prevotellaceae bacterium]